MNPNSAVGTTKHTKRHERAAAGRLSRGSGVLRLAARPTSRPVGAPGLQDRRFPLKSVGRAPSRSGGGGFLLVLHGIPGGRERSVRGGASEIAPAFGVRVLAAPLSLRDDTPRPAPRRPWPHSQSAGSGRRTPNARASKRAPDLSALLQSPRNPVKDLFLDGRLNQLPS